jgi:outer membrane lipoprotein-sorting protein
MTQSGTGIRHYALLAALAGFALASAAGAADRAGAPRAGLTAAQVVERNIAARGGLPAWRAVQTLSLSGKLEAGSGDLEARAANIAAGAGRSAHAVPATALAGATDKPVAAQQVLLPITLEFKRPHKSRVAIEFAGKTALQVYDGSSGWKLRPYLNRSDYEPFTAQEAEDEAQTGDLDGQLVDYAAKGTRIALEGMEQVEGHDAYKLRLTLKGGQARHVWIDARTFLDVKLEGVPRRMDGRMHDVAVYQRDFRAVQGVLIPFVLETAVEGYPQTHKVSFDKAAVNVNLDDTLFAKPRA